MNQKRLSFVMKLLALLMVFFACFLAEAQTSVQFTFANGQYSLSQYTNVLVQIQSEHLNASGSVTILQPPIYRYTDTNASVTFSNLAGNYSGGYYHWTVPAFTSANGFNPPVKSEGDIQIVSTNLGLIPSTSVGVTFVPVYNGFGAAWTAQASDLRYSQSSNNLTSYVQIGQLNSTSNSLVSQIASVTNGINSAAYFPSNAFDSFGMSATAQTNAQTFASTNKVSLSQLPPSVLTNGFSSTFVTFNDGLQVNGDVTLPDAGIFYTHGNFEGGNFLGNGAGLTGILYSNIVGVPAIPSTNGFINSATATNIANSIYSNNPSGYISASATNQLVNTNALANYTLLTAFTSGTNSVATNGAANLIATNNLLIASFNSSLSNLNLAMAAATNALYSSKQPASLTLSNLSATGAFTNILNAGANIYLTTNVSGTIVSINASNQTFLTNSFGSIVTHNATDYILTNALPALTNGFVTSSVTNGLATIAYVNSQIGSGVGFTNGLVAGQNVTLTTNFSGTIVSVNATNQTFLTNGFGSIVTHAATDYILTNALPALTNGFVSATITNGLVGASITNGFATTNYVNAQGFVTATATNGLATTNFVLSTLINSNANFATFATVSASNTANLVITTNFVIASTNGGNIVFTNSPQFTMAITNVSALMPVTNGLAQGWFGFGTKTNFLLTTNIVSIIGGGSPVEGTYLNGTNTFNHSLTIVLSGGNYYIQSNGVSLYQSANIVTWTLVSGVNPPPQGAWGTSWHMNGTVLRGFVTSTNLTWQITNTIANMTILANTNFVLSGYIEGFTTNNQFSTSGTNTIINLIAQYGVNPTNGISAATATNIAAAQAQMVTNGFTAIVFSNPATFYLNSNPSNYTAFQLVTNLIQQATNGITGGGGTNAAQVFFTPTNPYSITAQAASIAFNTNGCMWINRNGNSNNWLNIITNN